MLNEQIRLWLDDESLQVSPVTVGNINETFFVQSGSKRYVLQKLNPIFAPEINLDIEDLTTHLSRKGFSTPKLCRARDGDLWKIVNKECWRLLTFVEGDNLNAIKNTELAKRAGRLVGEFHAAASDFRHTYHFARLNVHDTKGHIEKLKTAIVHNQKHERTSQVFEIAERIFSAIRILPDLTDLPKRHSHGDLKINNLLFGSKTDSLIDLDTIGYMPWPIEMADAFRSWCNPLGEDDPDSRFDEELFEAALSAYTQPVCQLWTREETDRLVDAMLTIPLELSSRFLRDVLEDCYFGYNANRFSSRADHNLARARSQFAVYCEIDRKRAIIESIVRRAFA